ncbi:MAG: hypothetical protein M1825_004530 [Sarcosagium campestre]|nr:MAG: hypothetical protein M1825_004530 [Sarcosagium campestre]
MSLPNVDVQRHDGDDDDDDCFQAFQREMQLKDDAKRLAAEEQSALKKSKRFSTQKQWRQQIKRTQQYLRLHGARSSLTGPVETICRDLEDTLTSDGASGLSLRGLSQALTHDLGGSAVFISVDIEAFEFNQNFITEIGISTLDTVDLLGVLPETRGNGWATKIRSRHFRIYEHRHRINKVRVESCPENFDFGRSEWIHERDVLSRLQECFNPPPSRLGLHSGGTRKIVLVAHNAAADIKYLTKLGFEVTQFISDCIDTADLFRAARRSSRQPALYNLLLQYGIAAKHLHNAGNDAHYTLRVVIAIALDVSQNRRTAEEWEAEKHSRIDAACREARAKVCAEFEGWSTSEDDDVADSAVLTMNQQLGGEAPGPGKERYAFDVKPMIERARLRKEGQPVYRSQTDNTLGDVAVQDNPCHQDVAQGYFTPFDSSSKGNLGSQDTRHHDESGGRNRSRGRGGGRDRGRGRGRSQDRRRGHGRNHG